MYVWPFIFECGVSVPGWVLMSRTTAKGGPAQRHAKRAIVVFVAMYMLDALWLAVIASGVVASVRLVWVGRPAALSRSQRSAGCPHVRRHSPRPE